MREILIERICKLTNAYGQRMKKVLPIVMLVVVTGILGMFIYFVASISSTYPPIKEYSYAGSIDKFFANIHERVAIDSNMHFNITDTTGLQTTSPAIYFIVSIGKVEYGLKGQKHKTSKGYETNFALVSVFDHDRNIGGYSKDVADLQPLINKLEATIPSLHVTE